MKWNTKITKLLSIDYPILLGAMANISNSTLAAAMYRAGGCGVIGSGGFTADRVREEIRKAKDLLGPDGVYGVNLMLQAPNKDDILQVICEEKVPFVTLGAGNPIPCFEPLHRNGIRAFRSSPMYGWRRRSRQPVRMPWSWKAWKPAAMTERSPSPLFWKMFSPKSKSP